MAHVTGKTKNGYTYEGDYESAGAGRILWNATYRRDGDFAGIRHGQLRGMQDLPAAAVDDAVKDGIESTWTDAG